MKSWSRPQVSYRDEAWNTADRHFTTHLTNCQCGTILYSAYRRASAISPPATVSVQTLDISSATTAWENGTTPRSILSSDSKYFAAETGVDTTTKLVFPFLYSCSLAWLVSGTSSVYSGQIRAKFGLRVGSSDSSAGRQWLVRRNCHAQPLSPFPV